MAIDAATVRRIALLARIRLEPDETDRLVAELGSIIGWVEQLDAIDVDGVEPLTGPRETALRMRDDVVTEPDRRAALLANAPAQSRGFFAVPKVVE